MWLKRSVATLIATIALGTAAGAVTLHPDRVQLDWVFGADENAVYNNSTNGVYDVVSGQEANFFGLVGVDVGAGSISLSLRSGTRFNRSRNFNGLRIRDVDDTLPDFTQFVQTTNGNGIITLVTEDDLYINFAQTRALPQSLDFEYQIAPVPVAASAVMILTGVSGIGWHVRRRKKRAAA